MNTHPNPYVAGLSPPWHPLQARGTKPEEKWAALAATKPTSTRFRLVADREISDAQKWNEICAELGLAPWPNRNAGDVIYALSKGK